MEQVKKIKPVFEDERGQIFDLVNNKNIKHIGMIISHAGTVRGNHYHKLATQYTYILKGKVEVKSRDVKKPKSNTTTQLLHEGELVTHKPMTAHSLKFLEDSVILVFTTEPRENGKYEKDTYKTII